MARERLYLCKTCNHQWWQVYSESGDNDVFCQNAGCQEYQGQLSRPQVKTDGVAGVHSKALEFTGRMLEDDYGIPPSQLNDNRRSGDDYVKTPAPKGGEAAPEVRYMGSTGDSKSVVEGFLKAASNGGGLGASGNLTGIDILQGAAKTGRLPNPLKHAQMMGTKD